MMIKGRKPQLACAGKGIGATVGGVTYSAAAKIAAEGIYEFGEFIYETAAELVEEF